MGGRWMGGQQTADRRTLWTTTPADRTPDGRTAGSRTPKPDGWTPHAGQRRPMPWRGCWPCRPRRRRPSSRYWLDAAAGRRRLGEQPPGPLSSKDAEDTHAATDGSGTAATVSCRWYAAVQLAPWRTAVLGRLRVERRANGDASSVMAVGGEAGLCCLVGRVGWGAALVPASCQAERAVMHRRGLGRTGLLPGNHPFFEVIVPSLPGFGFSSPLPENPDMNFWRVADLWHTLLTRGPRRGTEIRRSVAI